METGNVRIYWYERDGIDICDVRDSVRGIALD